MRKGIELEGTRIITCLRFSWREKKKTHDFNHFQRNPLFQLHRSNGSMQFSLRKLADSIVSQKNQLLQGSANSFYKGPSHEYLQLCGHRVSITTTQRCCYSESSCGQSTKDSPWLCPNKTLFAKRGSELDLACGPYFASPWVMAENYEEPPRN